MGCASSCHKELGIKKNPNRFRNTALSVSYPLSHRYDPNVLLEWKSANKTEKYHWWPILDKNTEQEDYINNLFARGGGIDKYDKLCGTNALEYQKKHHRIPMDSNRKDKYWAGFCDKAATLSCLYKYPQKHVTACFNGKTMEFSPRDIEALLICVCENSIRRGLTVFYGSRNNHSDEKLKTIGKKFKSIVKSEPLPLDLLEILRRFSRETEPFVMDIDNGNAVWNYPYDSVLVTKESNKEYLDYLPSKGRNTVMRFQIKSEAYPEKNMDIKGYVNYNQKFVEQGWISKTNPDFLWKQYPQEVTWMGKSKMNPFIDCYFVYSIYTQSLSPENKIVKLIQ